MLFAEKAWNTTADGLLFGNPGQIGVQALAVAATIVYSGAATWAILKLVNAIVPLRAEATDEGLGLDVSQHGEEAYGDGEGAILVLPDAPDVAPGLTASAAIGGRS